MSDTFSRYHPVVNFLFFALVLVFSMVLMHPVCLLISLLGAVLYVIQLNGRKGLRLSLRIALPVMLLAALVNPAFNHAGMTILTYLPTGNPLTLESILYGLAAGCMLCAVLLWFVCYNRVLTSDKFVYLFGRVIPALSLVLSMTLRFVPRFKQQMDTVRQAQFCIGRDASSGSVWQRARKAVTIFSIMVTWALENAIETADRLKEGLAAKGYRFYMESPTNQVFPILANSQLEALEGKAKFGFWEKYDDTHTVMRIATSWATRMEEIEQLIALM